MIRLLRSKPFAAILAAAAFAWCCAAPRSLEAAQGPAADPKDQSLPATLEAIHHARVVTRILYITAHPDDESGTLLTYLSRGMGAEVALLTLTRGQGGQNAIGPEQGDQLGVIRSHELLEATRVFGVRLFFTRAPDFGFSKTLEETLKMWEGTALPDMVRVIRTFRPDIVINGWDHVRGGHGNHQASGYLTPKAFEAAADPKAFPEQLAEGLRPWRAKLLVESARGASARGLSLPLGEVSAIWGKTYSEIALEGFVQHRSQGLPRFANSPFLRRAVVLAGADGEPFDPRLLAEPLAALAENYPALAAQMRPALEQAEAALHAARRDAPALDWPKAVQDLAQAGLAIARLQAELSAANSEQKNEALWELERVRAHIDRALAAAAALRIQAFADRDALVPGEDFSVRVRVRRREDVPGEFARATLALPVGWNVTKEENDSSGDVRLTVAVPAGAKTPHSSADWMLPFPPPLVHARVHVLIGGYGADIEAPVVAERASSTEVTVAPLRLVPAVTLALDPSQFVIVEAQPPGGLELLARVHSYLSAAAKVTVGLDLPTGWPATPAQTLEFTGTGDRLVRFHVKLPEKVPAGNYALRAWASRDGEKYTAELEPLPSLPSYLWSEPAVAPVHAFDIAVPRNLRVGYVAAGTDPIPDALRRLGISVEMLDPAALEFGDLGRFDAIVVGIRAYELRSDLAAANQRLLDYAAAGGTLVVQYERNFVWDSLKPAPYPATMGRETLRTTDEDAEVKFLAPQNPLLHFPNRITEADFGGWVQERGLYYWGEFDSRYTPVLGMHDPGEAETNGSLVYARYGKGTYIYTGLSFFRQLPEGNSGAYRLFVNLISQSRAEAGR